MSFSFLGAGVKDAHRTLADRAFGAIHDAILSGELVPGARLPIEELAEALGMSPMPVREALRRLDSAGLVENIAHRGARVAELSIEDLAEVYEARLALEALAVRRAAECRTHKDVAEAAEALATFRRSAKRPEASDAHREFHFALYRAGHSRWLIRLIALLWESAERYRLAAARTIGWRLDEHDEILNAVRDADSEAADRLMYNHLARTANELAGQMGGKELFALRTGARPPGSRGRTGSAVR